MAHHFQKSDLLFKSVECIVFDEEFTRADLAGELGICWSMNNECDDGKRARTDHFDDVVMPANRRRNVHVVLVPDADVEVSHLLNEVLSQRASMSAGIRDVKLSILIEIRMLKFLCLVFSDFG